MNTSTVLNRISSLLSASALLVYGCAKETPQVPPATLADIAQAACILHGGLGQGVLVGFNDQNDERVFLLTARHVATDQYAPDNRVDLLVGGQHKMTINNSRERWLTTKEGNDSAWIELTPSEIAEFRAADALHYIALTNGPNTVEGKGIPGTCTRGYEEILNMCDNAVTTSVVTLFFQNACIDATARHDLCGISTFRSAANRRYHNVTSKYVCVIAPRQTHPGESGGAVFTQIGCGRSNYWMLSGLIIGGNEINTNRCAVVPVDDAVEAMRYCNRRLIDLPWLW